MVDRDVLRAFDGDQLLYVIAMDYRRRKALTGGVVGTLMTNLEWSIATGARRRPLDRAAVGDRYVLEKLEGKALADRRGELGHILCLDKHSTGDAIVAALAVLRALVEQRCEPSRKQRQASRSFRSAPHQRVRVPTATTGRATPRSAMRRRRHGRRAGGFRTRALASVRHGAPCCA